LLTHLGYQIEVVDNAQSGRAFISKGLLEEAKICANQNIETYKGIVNKEKVLIGLEPSAILTFRDEYLRLANNLEDAKHVANYTFLIDEFLEQEIIEGNIKSNQFVDSTKIIYLHGHCHQKALSDIKSTCAYLDLPENYQVINIPSGCCGMAGSFGYEKEHYEISMKIGEHTLFPAIRNLPVDSEIVALGTSCRHQILDGTDKVAKHPISILRAALKA
jgi:Fe-S oxidoreductase